MENLREKEINNVQWFHQSNNCINDSRRLCLKCQMVMLEEAAKGLLMRTHSRYRWTESAFFAFGRISYLTPLTMILKKHVKRIMWTFYYAIRDTSTSHCSYLPAQLLSSSFFVCTSIKSSFFLQRHKVHTKIAFDLCDSKPTSVPKISSEFSRMLKSKGSSCPPPFVLASQTLSSEGSEHAVIFA